MEIYPIRTEEDHERAVQRIATLIGAAPDSAEGNELDILATLVDAYEAKHYLMDAPSPIAAIEFRMEQQGLTRKDLEPLIGTRARVSEILRGSRPLTLNMIRRLKSGLGISADLLIEATPGNKPRRKNKSVVTRKSITKSTKRVAAHTVMSLPWQRT
jgi:HTH-type transcriptional regulator/antitoxin HigA